MRRTDAASFYEHEAHNRRASLVILAGTFVLLLVVVSAVATVVGTYSSRSCTFTPSYRGPVQQCTTSFHLAPLTVGIIAAFVAGYLIVAWYASGRAALALNRAQPADPQRYQELHEVVEEMAIAAGVPKPEVYVVDDPAPNAFATGRNPDHAAITATTGLLDTMSRRELRGVIAHEMSHVRNRDIAVTTLAVLAVGAIVVIADVALRVGFVAGGGRRGRGQDQGGLLLLLLGLALMALAVPAGMLLRAALSRRREALADASAVELTREPTGLRSALEKLEADTTVVDRPSAATAHLWIESPLERDEQAGVRGTFGRMMDTHPPLAERIALLRGYEGLDPSGRGPNDPFPEHAV